MIINFFLLCFCVVNNSSLCATVDIHEHLSIKEHTHAIYERFYLIKRLTIAINMIYNSRSPFSYDHIDPLLFNNALVQKAAYELVHHGAINEFMHVWNIFTSYKCLYDEGFTSEYIRLIYLLFIHRSATAISHITQEELLFIVDDCIDQATDNIIVYKDPLIMNGDTYVTTDLIAHRYCIIKRLHKALLFLETVCDKCTDFLSDHELIKKAIQTEIPMFQHYRVKGAFEDMCETNSFAPFFKLCSEFQHYRRITDNEFVKELVIGILVIYKGFLLKCLVHHTEHVTMLELNRLLEAFDMLQQSHVAEALDVVDDVTDCLVILQKLEEQKGSATHTWFLPNFTTKGLGLVIVALLGIVIAW